MADNIIGDIYTHFDKALSGFYEGAASGISAYVIPVAWIVLGICVLIWCYLLMQGKVAVPATDWLLKFIGFMLVLHVMGNGYLGWVATPIFNLPSELTAAASHSSSDAPTLLGQVNTKVIDLISALFTAASSFASDLAIGAAITVFLLTLLVTAAAYLLLSTALFAVIFAKLGLSLVLAVGPFFVLALVLPQTRSLFFSWISTALYFVFYHLFTALFIFLFIGVVDVYLSRLASQIDRSGGGEVSAMAAQLIDAGGNLSVIAICIPVILISLAMFCMFLQIPAICASMTGGSGGTFFPGLGALARMRRAGRG
jgi:type IV secretion system protein VirB6